MGFAKSNLLLLTVLAGLLAGCGAGYQMVYDPTTGTYVQAMYNPATGTYVQANGMPLGSSSAYGSTYDPYGSTTDTSSAYGTSYDTSTAYGSSYDPYGTYSSPTAVPTAAPTAAPQTSIADQPVLNAYVLRSDQSGLLGYGKVVASVQVENPSNRSLSGTLRVVFTDAGDPTANVQSQRVTLHPLEKQVLTFTASGHIDGAQASITTDGATTAPASTGKSTMTDLN
ncbi:MAG TPA: hypothetical protein V6D47_03375 [Oscillatoriaceae cyanobacterium]